MFSFVMSISKLKSSRSAPFSSCSSSICKTTSSSSSMTGTTQGFQLSTKEGEKRSYVFVVVGAYLLLQQGQQIIKTAGKFLLLDLHKQPTNLSAESLKADLGSEHQCIGLLFMNVGVFHTWNTKQPCLHSATC